MAEVSLEPLFSMPLTCLDGQITPTLNRLDLKPGQTLTVRVQAPNAVEWALRVTR